MGGMRDSEGVPLRRVGGRRRSERCCREVSCAPVWENTVFLWDEPFSGFFFHHRRRVSSFVEAGGPLQEERPCSSFFVREEGSSIGCSLLFSSIRRNTQPPRSRPRGTLPKRDSIRSKVFGRRGEGVRGKGESFSSEKFPLPRFFAAPQPIVKICAKSGRRGGR